VSFKVSGIDSGRDEGKRLSINQHPPRARHIRIARRVGSPSSSVCEEDNDIDLDGVIYLNRR
jgi:hypothetical protein